MRQQCESLQRELSTAQDHARQQSLKIQSLERETIELSSRLDQDSLCARVEATDSMIQLMSEKADLEIRCRQLKANLAGMGQVRIVSEITVVRAFRNKKKTRKNHFSKFDKKVSKTFEIEDDSVSSALV